MLLLRKKKYAAVKLQFKDGKVCEVIFNLQSGYLFFLENVWVSYDFSMQDIERKGVDMVRRDWSLLSKEIGDLCLAKILYGGYVLIH